MTTRERIENEARAIRDFKDALISLATAARETSSAIDKSLQGIGKSLLESKMANISQEDVESYKQQVLDYAAEAGFQCDEIADKLTDEFLRTSMVVNSTPERVLISCLV